MTIQSVFRGPGGYRAGWRFLFFCFILFGLQWGISFLLDSIVVHSHVQVPEWPNAIVITIQDGCTLLAVLTATLLMAKMERRRLSDYYIPGRDSFGRQFWLGCGFGAAGVSLLIGLIALAGGYSLGGLNLHRAGIVRAALLWLLASLAIGFTEEMVFRAYPQYTLASGMGFWPAAALISIAFGALHYFTKPEERWTDWASVSLLAMFVCLTVWRTGSLRFAIGFHAAFDFFAIYFYSGPNGGRVAADRLFNASFHGSAAITGGPLGPEASLLVFPVLAVMFLAFHLGFRGKSMPPGNSYERSQLI